MFDDFLNRLKKYPGQSTIHITTFLFLMIMEV